jgi:transposase
MPRVFTRKEVDEMIRAAVAEATAALRERIAQLEGELAKARKDSSTSSKPPSSDIVKPPKPKPPGGRRRKRRRGGQPGHPRHLRAPFAPEQVDEIWLYEWTETPAGRKPLEEFRVVQQAELLEKPYRIVEHRARLYENQRTGKIEAVPLPKEVLRGGLLGPRLTALVAYQKGACHMSYGTIQRFFDDVLGLPISTGELVKTVMKVSTALGPGHEQLRQALRRRESLGIDETGHRERGRRMWSWCFHAPGSAPFTWFHIDPSRGTKVLRRCLGKAFRGIIGCDYYAAYRKFLRETSTRLQLCWAHLIRDVKFLTTLSDPVTRRYGERVLGKIKVLFRAWHRRETTPAERWRLAAERIRGELLAAVRRAPMRKEAQNIAQRFRDHGDGYFTFLDTPGIEPTNNGPERQIRFLAVDRKITQGTRGQRGRQWCERIWTVLATCAQQGRSAFRFLHETVLASWHHESAPSLLAQPP